MSKTLSFIYFSDQELQVQDPGRSDGAGADTPRRRSGHSDSATCGLLRLSHGMWT